MSETINCVFKRSLVLSYIVHVDHMHIHIYIYLINTYLHIYIYTYIYIDTLYMYT